jgi:L-lactate dehydrogenase complex protein LldG
MSTTTTTTTTTTTSRSTTTSTPSGIEMNTSAARGEILARIRAALADVPPGETAEMVPVPRHYLKTEAAPLAGRVDQFLHRVAEYKAAIHRVTPAELPGRIAERLGARGVCSLVVPADLPEEWIPSGIRVLRDPRLSHQQIESGDGVLTAAALGIAQTGTIVLDGGPGQGRRALTLLPDYHLCVIGDDQIVGLVPEAVTRLEASARSPGHPITWISGPSATSDIELNRVEGVHGPRTLEVLVVMHAATAPVEPAGDRDRAP